MDRVPNDFEILRNYYLMRKAEMESMTPVTVLCGCPDVMACEHPYPRTMTVIDLGGPWAEAEADRSRQIMALPSPDHPNYRYPQERTGDSTV